jgi:xanthine dehydrogenase accessory factor
MNNVLQIALKAAQENQSYAFATVVESTVKGTPQKAGAKMIVLEDGTLVGTIGGGRNEKAAREECLKAIKTGKPYSVTYDFFGREGQSVCGGQIKVFIEPFLGKKKLVICGAGHIALPLSVFAKILNFHVTVIDNRPEFLNKSRFPHVDTLILGPHAQKLRKFDFTRDVFIMIVTQGNEFDYECLKVAADKDIFYLGVISSRAKRIKFLKRLKAEGISQEYIDRVKIPAGFDIGAQTPEEIAISIISEMVSALQSERIGTDKFKDRFRLNKKDRV